MRFGPFFSRPGRTLLLSVVIPVYNEEPNLRVLFDRLTRVFSGLADVRYKLVFVDDGSTDASAEIVHGLQAEDARVKLLAKLQHRPRSREYLRAGPRRR